MLSLSNEIYEKLEEVITSSNFLSDLSKIDRDKTAFGYISYDLLYDARLFVSSCGDELKSYTITKKEISYKDYVLKLNKLSSRLRKSDYNKQLINDGVLLLKILEISLKQLK